jgi:hypothetical protein
VSGSLVTESCKIPYRVRSMTVGLAAFEVEG